MEAVELSRILSGKSHAPIVYFIRIGDRVKIGTTTNITERVKALSVTIAEVSHVMPGGPEVERALHQRWAKYRVHESREWFYVRGSLTAFLRPSTSGGDLIRQVSPVASNAVPESDRRYTLAAAARAVIIPMTADALRQAKRRDPDFPSGLFGTWTAEELRSWYRGRTTMVRQAEAPPPPGPIVPGSIGLYEAVTAGILTISLESARAARKRDPEFPEAVSKRGQELLYSPEALREWERNRPRSG